MNTFTITNKYINTNVLLVFLRWDLCFFFKKKLLANWWGGGGRSGGVQRSWRCPCARAGPRWLGCSTFKPAQTLQVSSHIVPELRDRSWGGIQPAGGGVEDAQCGHLSRWMGTANPKSQGKGNPAPRPRSRRREEGFSS